MSDHEEVISSTSEAPKVLTLKELLERKKKNLAQSKAFPGKKDNSIHRSKASAPKGGGHSQRSHRPQGG
jgi:hypothetical protein